MLVVNTDYITGYELEMLGMVQGSTVQTVNAFKDIGQGFKTLVGGEQKTYTKLMTQTRQIALDRMIDQAKSMGADAVVNVRFSTSEIMQGSSEVCATGTAVKCHKINAE